MRRIYSIHFAILLGSLFFISTLDAQNNLQGVGGFQEPLGVGSVAPMFAGIDQNGNAIDTKDILERSDIVLIFYRGVWCPYCRRHLGELQDRLQYVLDEGASVVVVTPERPEYIDEMITKTGATFSIIHDKDYEIMQAYKTAYRISPETVSVFRELTEKRVAEHNGNQDNILPIPATYILGQDGKVKYVHYERDFTTRAPIDTIIQQLQAMR